MSSSPSVWFDAASLLDALDDISRDGAVVTIKIDGKRPDDARYTIGLSGGRLGDEYFRKDTADLDAALREAIAFYRGYGKAVPRD